MCLNGQLLNSEKVSEHFFSIDLELKLFRLPSYARVLIIR